MRILAVDPGDRRIGLAISDPSGTLARPLQVLEHQSRSLDAALIAQIAVENKVSEIIIGQSFDMEGNPTPSGRKAARLADAIREQTSLPVKLWDESFTTQEALAIRISQGVSKGRRKGHQDDVAAAVLLQSFLDSRR